jgi:hypothetical protein
MQFSTMVLTMYVDVDERQHRASYDPLSAAGFVPRTNVKVAGSDGVMRVSSVRWKLANPPRPADTWDLGTWSEVKARVNRPPDQAATLVDAGSPGWVRRPAAYASA